ncbi:MAG TPA: ATP-binding protein [Mycobacterium sp.]|nr:ATP-binding protein [Mycobacterium sp.]
MTARVIKRGTKVEVREEVGVSQLAIPRRAAGRLHERLSENLSRRFVGRDAEITLFKDLLNRSGQAALLWVYGPGGVGKSTLLHRLAQLVSDKGMPVLFPDARDLPPTREGVVQGLRQALEPAIVSVEDGEQRWVILLDTCEHFSEAEASAVRTEVLSQLPATSLIVLAARARPGLAWLTDPGWGELLTPMPLHNLSPTEARTYLSRAGVPESRHDAVVAFTHGHPLSLALVGELGKHGDFDPSGSPDVLGSLLERLLSDVPGPSYRDAVYASAQVRVTDEGLLAVLLDGDVTAEFDWLRRQPYMESGLDGVFPHDLARDLLDKDLRWRNPQRQRVLHERAGRHYLRLMEVGDTEVQQSALFDLMALHPSLRAFVLAPSAGLRVTQGASADRAAVLSLIARHEGPESAELAAMWWDQDPGAWLIVRDRTAPVSSSLRAAMALTALPEPGGPLDVDPAVVAARVRLGRHPPVRPGERVTYVRWWLDAETYQMPSPAQTMLAVQLTRHYLTTPGLAVSFVPTTDPDTWLAPMLYTDQNPMPEADFALGGQRYSVFGHDWRAVPPARWLALMSERETAREPVPVPAERPGEAALLALSRQEFAQGVRSLLRELHRPDRLVHNPLLRCRLVESRLPATPAGADPGPDARLAALREVLQEAVTTLQASPRDAKGFRALRRTYLAPAPSQEVAAQVLGLPSSTYRRHLSAGLRAITDILWEQELHA